MGFVGTSELFINKRCTTPSRVQIIVRAIMKVTVYFLMERLAYHKISTQNIFPKKLVKNDKENFNKLKVKNCYSLFIQNPTVRCLIYSGLSVLVSLHAKQR